MDAIKKFLIGCAEFLLAESVNTIKLVGPANLVRYDIPFPTPQACYLLRSGKLSFSLSQLILYALSSPYISRSSVHECFSAKHYLATAKLYGNFRSTLARYERLSDRALSTHYGNQVVAESLLVRFSTEVTAATWATDHWEVRLDTGETLSAKAVISAVGQLNRPYIPDFPGTFDGPLFHTARWDHDVDLTGKDVVMVGAGATGFQVAPTIAEQVKSLTVIQRTAQWMFPNPVYHASVPQGDRWAMRHLPFYARWFRFVMGYMGLATGTKPLGGRTILCSCHMCTWFMRSTGWFPRYSTIAPSGPRI